MLDSLYTSNFSRPVIGGGQASVVHVLSRLTISRLANFEGSVF